MSGTANPSDLHRVGAVRGASSEQSHGQNYKGFVAGVFSGVTKCTTGHPFDTIKVRLQTSEKSQFRGPLDCLVQTVRHEGLRALFKGMSPPLIGWAFMDSLMLGSLTFYRDQLNRRVFNRETYAHPALVGGSAGLPVLGHGIAGMMAGWTVSLIAAPIGMVSSRLQIQYQVDKSKRLYSGPLDCSKKIIQARGIRGLYHGLGATLVFRTFFFFWWSSYEVLTRLLSKNTTLSTPAVNFWAGGMSAQIFWLTSYPSDRVKQLIMTDELGKGRRFPRWRDAVRHVRQEYGWKGYWRGFVPCFLRAFPANGLALVAFEGVMRAL